MVNSWRHTLMVAVRPRGSAWNPFVEKSYQDDMEVFPKRGLFYQFFMERQKRMESTRAGQGFP